MIKPKQTVAEQVEDEADRRALQGRREQSWSLNCFSRLLKKSLAKRISS
jgi:hypothetical protein